MILVNRILFIHKVVLAVAFWLLSMTAFAGSGSLKYEISTGWIDLGHLTLKWEKRSDSLIVHSLSEVSISFLFGTREMIYDTKLLFHAGSLIHSLVNVFVNNELTEYTYTKKHENGYSVVRKEKDEDEIKNHIAVPDIKMTTTMLLFNQPKGNEDVYAELHAVISNIEAGNSDEFLLLNNKTNKKTHYKYESGVLSSSRMTNPLMDFKLNLVKP